MYIYSVFCIHFSYLIFVVVVVVPLTFSAHPLFHLWFIFFFYTHTCVCVFRLIFTSSSPGLEYKLLRCESIKFLHMNKYQNDYGFSTVAECDFAIVVPLLLLFLVILLCIQTHRHRYSLAHWHTIHFRFIWRRNDIGWHIDYVSPSFDFIKRQFTFFSEMDICVQCTV